MADKQKITVPTKLMQEALAVMRECGWQNATKYKPQSDGILEAACTEIEGKFSELLEGNNDRV